MSNLVLGKILLAINIVIPLTLAFFTIVRSIKVNEYYLIDDEMDEESEAHKRIVALKKNTRVIRLLFDSVMYLAICIMSLELILGISCSLQMMGRSIFTYEFTFIREMTRDYTINAAIFAGIICLICFFKHVYVMKHIKKSNKYNDEERKFLREFFSLKLKD